MNSIKTSISFVVGSIAAFLGPFALIWSMIAILLLGCSSYMSLSEVNEKGNYVHPWYHGRIQPE